MALPEVVAALADVVAELSPTARKMGVFRESVAVEAKASAFARLLTATGRAPYRS
ncbi:hypothetical protein [Streptomyces sp. NPDC055134]